MAKRVGPYDYFTARERGGAELSWVGKLSDAIAYNRGIMAGRLSGIKISELRRGRARYFTWDQERRDFVPV
jgi:hypothetical protein